VARYAECERDINRGCGGRPATFRKRQQSARQRRPLAPAEAAQLSLGIAAAVAAVHEKGVLHRDLKPANATISGRGQALISDLGLAALAALPVDAAGWIQ
jgi:serine/threonine protein kinase